MRVAGIIEEKKKLVVYKIHLIILLNLFIGCRILNPSGYLLKSNLKDANKFVNVVYAERLKKDLSILSSDDFEGRETSFSGQKKAAAFIKENLIRSGLKSLDSNGNYFQTYDVEVLDFSKVSVVLNNDTLNFLEDFYSFGNPEECVYNNISVVDVDYGVVNKKINNYQDVNVENKVVLLKEGIPDDTLYNTNDANWRNKINSAKERGAIAVIFSKANYKNTDSEIKKYLANPSMKMHNTTTKKNQIPVFFIDENIITKSNNQISFSVNIRQKRSAENVIAYIPGLTEENIVISAHYDHIGFDQGQVCNGADDNGSGTAALLSIASAFKSAFDSNYFPKRGIIFLFVSGEEKGLFGSKYYTENPLVPLKATVANLNIDMIGRKDTIHKDNNYIYLIGSDRINYKLHLINEQINSNFINFNLDYKYNAEDDPNHFYYRSDHYNFAKQGIPVIFYFGGLHKDYHKPTDDVDLIDFSKLEKTSRYIFLTAWELAYREKKI